MESNQIKRFNYSIFLPFVVLVIIIGLILGILFLFVDKTENYSISYDKDSVSSLSCSAENLDESFFDISQASYTKQEIKMSFSDDKINTIMYTLEADYNDNKTTRITEASFHAHYDNYMSGHGVGIETVSNTFTLSENKIRVKLYAEKRSLNSATSHLFLLDPSVSYSDTSLQDYYQSKGFICNFKD